MYRWILTTGVFALTVSLSHAGIQVPDNMKLKGKDGKTYAVVIDCPQTDAKGPDANSYGGSEDSMIGKDRCGSCLVDANYGHRLTIPYDQHVKGTLVNEKGEPIQNQMVQFFLPNGWTVKTRTSSAGYFRILMGATDERRGPDPLTLDLGQRRLKSTKKLAYYAVYMLPDDFQPCGEAKKGAAASKKKAAPAPSDKEGAKTKPAK